MMEKTATVAIEERSTDERDARISSNKSNELDKQTNYR